jgi:N-methylhydantoinase B
VIRWRAEQDDLAVICLVGGSSDATAPFGLEGGGRGRPNWSRIIRSDGALETVIGNSTLRLDRGDVVEVHTSGGGGFGDPLEREPAQVAADVRAGLLTPRRAAADYAVVVNEAGIIDRGATQAHRAERSRADTKSSEGRAGVHGALPRGAQSPRSGQRID